MYKMIANIKNRTKTQLRNSETKSATPTQDHYDLKDV